MWSETAICSRWNFSWPLFVLEAGTSQSSMTGRKKAMQRSMMLVGVLLLVGMLVLAACGSTPVPTAQAGQAGLPNPAAVYCEEHGGKVDIREDPQGGQYGVCMFNDGTECDEWAYYRGECKPGQMTKAPVPQTTP
jgi:putative hemolysin